MSYTIKLDAWGRVKLTEGSDTRYITVEDSDKTITDSKYHVFDLGGASNISFTVADTSPGYLFCKCDTGFRFGFNNATTTTMSYHPAEGWVVMAFTAGATFYVFNDSGTAAQAVIGFWLT